MSFVDLLLVRRQGTIKSEFRGFVSPMSSPCPVQMKYKSGPLYITPEIDRRDMVLA